MQKITRTLLSLAGAAGAPFLLMSLYLRVSRSGGVPHAGWDYAALGASLVIGIAFLAWLPIGRKLRVGLTVLYLPLAAAALVYYAISFVCRNFGACL